VVSFEDRVREVADFVEHELRAAYRRGTEVRPVATTVRSTRASAVQAGAIKRVVPQQA